MTDYCNQFFGKSIDNLSYEDVEIFFRTEKEESTILEFKSGQQTTEKFEENLNKKIIRTITSFLNSEGGVLIWGSPREVETERGGKTTKIAQGDLVPNTVFNDKDQLINKIIRAISYLPSGIRLVTLKNEENYIYIFEVQESESKPHQYQNQYPIRLDGQTIPAPHYFVEAMFKTIKLPILEGKIIFSAWRRSGSSLFIDFSVLLENRSLYSNELSVSYQLVAHPGKFMGARDGQLFGETHPVLHFGRPLINNHTLIIPFPIGEKLQEIRIVLAFGGEKSVALTSTYVIDPKRFNQQKPFDFSHYVIHYIENQNLKEKQEELGVTHEESFNHLINRLRPSRSKPPTSK